MSPIVGEEKLNFDQFNINKGTLNGYVTLLEWILFFLRTVSQKWRGNYTV